MFKSILFLCFLFSSILVLDVSLMADEKKVQSLSASYQEELSLEAFISEASRKDMTFEEILIDELTLQYQHALELPAKDLVAAVKSGYEFYFHPDREELHFDATLSKLFPKLGTEFEVAYAVDPTSSSGGKSPSSFSFSIAQPIAENAFGKSTRLLDEIVSLEVVIAKHQIVEAYEDYLALLMQKYFEWYESYETLKIAESSYAENLKLLNNMKERQKSNIALPIDVNKIELQVIGREEVLITRRQEYESALNFIRRAFQDLTLLDVIPTQSSLYNDVTINFDQAYKNFRNEGRTYQVLRLLEEKSSLQVDRDLSELLPSVNLLLDVASSGVDGNIKRNKEFLFAGFEVEVPFGNQVDEARLNTNKILQKKATLQTTNTHYLLYTDIRNLYEAILREKKLLELAGDKLLLAESILKDESENYRLGKGDLNDYIQAVNSFDSNRFNQVNREVTLQRLFVEWYRLTDQLVNKKEIEDLLTL